MRKDIVWTTDDVCLSNLKYFQYWQKVKEKTPNLRLICFTIANYRAQESLAKSEEFRDWFEANKDWVEIGVHGYDHLSPPEQERDDAEELVKKSLEMLKPFLPEKYLYRPPGFQTTIRTEPILKRLGFAGVAHQTRIKYFDGSFAIPFNTHCCDRYFQPITKIWSRIIDQYYHCD